MKTYLQMDGDRLVEYIEKREHDALMLVAHDLVTERDEARDQLARICKEGFGNDDTIGLEPGDDYALRQVAKMRDAIREAHKIIQVLYMDALDHHKESWPRANEWMAKQAAFTTQEP